MGFTKILAATDFSAGSAQALRQAARLASDHQAELVLTHAWYLPATAYVPDAPFPASLVQSIRDDARRSLDAAVRDAMLAGAKDVTSTLVDGVAWTEIVGQLEREAFDLCVLGTQGRTGIARFLLGSVAEKVVRHAPCSVLAVRPGAEAKPFSHVLVPMDFSDSANHALQMAPTLVVARGALTVLHVIEPPVGFSPGLALGGFEIELNNLTTAALANAAATLGTKTTATVNLVTRGGAPGPETLDLIASDPSIDLVVMGSHGRTGLKRAVMGSVAEKVVRHARCPVLVARTRA